jgi:rfaE bifunctional protein kinase chain/domain
LLHHEIDSELGEDPEMETTLKMRITARAQQMLRIDFEKRPNIEKLAYVLKRYQDVLSQYDVVLLSDYGKGGLTDVEAMIQIARNLGKPVLVDPKGSDWTRYTGASVITPNRGELAQIVGSWSNEQQLIDKAQALREKLDLEALLLTRSEEGVTLFRRDCVISVPAQSREVIDVTGAGDTVIATFALMIACGTDLPQAASVANRAGGLVVAKFGTASLKFEELRDGS